MPDPNLPPSVYQGLGWSPAADPSTQPQPLPGDGAQDFGGLPPAIPQAMGWAQPPMAAQLPSAADRAPSAPTGASPDYPVPVSQFGKKATPVAPGRALVPVATPQTQVAKPQTFDQQMDALQKREAETEQAQQGAVQAGVEAQQGLHADQLAAYRKADETVQANAEQRKAEADSWKKITAANEAKTAADKQQIESWKFNRNKYLDELGVGGKVRWGIGMILAGIGQGMMRQGGANPVLEMLQQNIHDANAEQYKQRDALVEQLGFDRQSGQDAATYHATRQAELDKADGLAYAALGKQLEEAAIKSADPIAQAAGLKEAANIRSMGDERLKSYIQLKSEHDQKQAQIGIAGGELALNRQRFGLEQQKFSWEKDKEQQQLDINAAKLLATKQGKLDEEQAKRALYIPGPDGQLVVARKQDGSPVLSGSAEIASKDQNMIAAAGTYNRLVGQMIRGIREHGGESDYLKSRDWQNMQSDFEAAVAELHDGYQITSFREPTVKFFEKMASGGVDPKSFIYDASSALQRSNQNLQAKVNERIQARGYDGPKFGWQDTTNPPTPTPTDDERVAGKALLNPASQYDKEPQRVQSELGVRSQSFQRQSDLTSKVADRLREEGGVLPSVRQAIGTWGAALSSPDTKVADHYRILLEKIAEESESPQTAALAQQMLDRAREKSIATTPVPPERVQGSGRPGSP